MSVAKETVAVGISGGVDSAIAAFRLQKENYKVFGLFMKNWEEDDNEHCAAAEDLEYAEQVCRHLGIQLYTVNFSTEYWDRVFTFFLREYRVGRTPNPDVICNQEIKFKEFLQHAQRLGADKIATGHYAGIQKDKDRYNLLKALDKNKDQSYFLYAINQDALANSLFPLAELHKEKVRDIARQINLPNAERKDSTGICFIGERKFRRFLAQYIREEPGEIMDTEGNLLGKHQGAWFYTIGQREGLGIGGTSGNNEQAWYVAEKDMEKNRLTVVQGQNHKALYHTGLTAEYIHWINKSPDNKTELHAKIRYRQTAQKCHITAVQKQLKVRFDEPQWAITPGQSVVFYSGRNCLGGGIITQANL